MVWATDEDIDRWYSGCEIIQIQFNPSRQSGWILLKKEDDEFEDNFVIYQTSGKIAFDRWYPEGEYLRLCNVIKIFAALDRAIKTQGDRL